MKAFRTTNFWIPALLLLVNGLAWFAVANRVNLPPVEPILHPDVAEVRRHWQAGDAVGEPFAVTINDLEAAQTIAWFISTRPNLPIANPQIEIHPDRVTGRGVVELAGLKVAGFATANIRLVNGKPEIDIIDLGVAQSSLPGFVLAALQSQVDQAQQVYEQLDLPIEITVLELREGEVHLEGVYR